MLANDFTQAFRDEHRQMRNALLGLIDAFEKGDGEQIQDSIGEMMAIAGPHFHYEGEALFPALAEIYGDEYVDQLLAEHDETAAATRELAVLADGAELSSDEAERAVKLAHEILPHVGERDGLAVMVEVMAPDQIGAILEARENAQESRFHLRKSQNKPATAKLARVAAAKQRGKMMRAAARPKARKPARKTASSLKKRAK